MRVCLGMDVLSKWFWAATRGRTKDGKFFVSTALVVMWFWHLTMVFNITIS